MLTRRLGDRNRDHNAELVSQFLVKSGRLQLELRAAAGFRKNRRCMQIDFGPQFDVRRCKLRSRRAAFAAKSASGVQARSGHLLRLFGARVKRIWARKEAQARPARQLACRLEGERACGNN